MRARPKNARKKQDEIFKQSKKFTVVFDGTRKRSEKQKEDSRVKFHSFF